MLNKEKNFRRVITLLLANILLLTALNAQVFYDAEAGIAVDTVPKISFKGADLNVRAFYGSQIQLGNNVLIEGEFSFITESVLQNIFLQDIPAQFSLDKLSLSYNIAGRNFNTRISGFAGNHDTVGTDDFFMTYFGTQSFNSSLFEQQIAFQQPGIFAIDGFGLEVNTVFTNSIAAAFYAYYNERYTYNQVNFDIRLAGVSDIAIIDFIFGASLPIDTKDSSGNDAILVIKRADLHTAVSLLIGDNPFANLYLQLGSTRIQIDPSTDINPFSLENLHVLIEPRFNIGNVNTSLSLFFIPAETVALIEYIEHSVGGGFHIDFTKNFGRTKANFGAHTTVSYEDGLDLEFNVSALSVMFVPYASFGSGSGELKISAPFKPLEYKTPEKMISATISYKASL